MTKQTHQITEDIRQVTISCSTSMLLSYVVSTGTRKAKAQTTKISCSVALLLSYKELIVNALRENLKTHKDQHNKSSSQVGASCHPHADKTVMFPSHYISQKTWKKNQQIKESLTYPFTYVRIHSYSPSFGAIPFLQFINLQRNLFHEAKVMRVPSVQMVF